MNNHNGVNIISSYISQAFVNMDYNEALNLYSECLQSILHKILIYTKDNTNMKENITNLINNETNIHTIIINAIQILKEQSFSSSPTPIVEAKILTKKSIATLSNADDVLKFIENMKQWLYFNCNFKHFLVKIIDLNVGDLINNRTSSENIRRWKIVYDNIINNYQNNSNNLYLINTIWFQQLRIIYFLYFLIDSKNISITATTTSSSNENSHNIQQQMINNDLITKIEMKEKEIEKLKQSYDELKANTIAKENENIRVYQTNKDLQTKMMEIEQSFSELKNANFELYSKNQEINKEIIELRNTNSELNSKNREIIELRNTNYELNSKNQEINKEIIELRNINYELNSKNQEVNNKLNESDIENNKMLKKNEEIEKNNNELDKTLKEYITEYNKLLENRNNDLRNYEIHSQTDNFEKQTLQQKLHQLSLDKSKENFEKNQVELNLRTTINELEKQLNNLNKTLETTKNDHEEAMRNIQIEVKNTIITQYEEEYHKFYIQYYKEVENLIVEDEDEDYKMKMEQEDDIKDVKKEIIQKHIAELLQNKKKSIKDLKNQIKLLEFENNQLHQQLNDGVEKSKLEQQLLMYKQNEKSLSQFKENMEAQMKKSDQKITDMEEKVYKSNIILTKQRQDLLEIERLISVEEEEEEEEENFHDAIDVKMKEEEEGEEKTLPLQTRIFQLLQNKNKRKQELERQLHATKKELSENQISLSRFNNDLKIQIKQYNEKIQDMGEKVANTLTERKENYYKNLLQIERLINKEEEEEEKRFADPEEESLQTRILQLLQNKNKEMEEQKQKLIHMANSNALLYTNNKQLISENNKMKTKLEVDYNQLMEVKNKFLSTMYPLLPLTQEGKQKEEIDSLQYIINIITNNLDQIQRRQDMLNEMNNDISNKEKSLNAMLQNIKKRMMVKKDLS